MGIIVINSSKAHVSLYIEELQDIWVTHSYITRRKKDRDREIERNRDKE